MMRQNEQWKVTNPSNIHQEYEGKVGQYVYSAFVDEIELAFEDMPNRRFAVSELTRVYPELSAKYVVVIQHEPIAGITERKEYWQTREVAIDQAEAEKVRHPSRFVQVTDAQGLFVWGDTDHISQSPEFVLDEVLGILTGFPSDETSLMDARGVAKDKMDEIMAYRNRIRLAGRIINSSLGILSGMKAESKEMTEHPLLEATILNLEKAIDALNGVHEYPH